MVSRRCCCPLEEQSVLLIPGQGLTGPSLWGQLRGLATRCGSLPRAAVLGASPARLSEYRTMRKARQVAPPSLAHSSISTWLRSTYVSGRTGAPLTLMGVSSCGFLKYKHGGCHASSKKNLLSLCSSGSKARSGTKWRKFFGWCRSPTGHEESLAIFLTMHRCHWGKVATSTKAEYKHSNKTSTESVGAAAPPGASGQRCEETPARRPRARPPSPSAWAGRSSAEAVLLCCVSSGGNARCARETMSRTAASAVPQIW
mmetsp:Transcript_79654/g.234307  ORF Transcript_79654/g.234307 Transcript_79654/m.234307 type:complete len:257 (-) Transcript_79654:1228-1998(-)